MHTKIWENRLFSIFCKNHLFRGAGNVSKPDELPFRWLNLYFPSIRKVFVCSKREYTLVYLDTLVLLDTEIPLEYPKKLHSQKKDAAVSPFYDVEILLRDSIWIQNHHPHFIVEWTKSNYCPFIPKTRRANFIRSLLHTKFKASLPSQTLQI